MVQHPKNPERNDDATELHKQGRCLRFFAMHSNPRMQLSSSRARSKVRVSVGPLYDRKAGKVFRAGLLAIGDGLVAPEPFWKMLHRLSREAKWLRGTFALATRPDCFGSIYAEGPLLRVSFRGRWKRPPALTLIIAGRDISEPILRNQVVECLVGGGLFENSNCRAQHSPRLSKFSTPYHPREGALYV